VWAPFIRERTRTALEAVTSGREATSEAVRASPRRTWRLAVDQGTGDATMDATSDAALVPTDLVFDPR
jgi:hypothetical protein